MNDNLPRTANQQRIADSIRQELADPASPWHTEFPPVVELKRRYGVGSDTVAGALRVLREDGLLHRRLIAGQTRGAHWALVPSNQGRLGFTRAEIVEILAQEISSARRIDVPSNAQLKSRYGVSKTTAEKIRSDLGVKGLLVKGVCPASAPTQWTLATTCPTSPLAIASAMHDHDRMERPTVAGAVEGKIRAELAKPDSPWQQDFPTPQRLAEIYGVCLKTAKKVVRSLANDGVLERRFVYSTNRRPVWRYLPPGAGSSVLGDSALADIMEGEIASGELQVLPPTAELAERWGVHRRTILLAFRRLESRGLTVYVRLPSKKGRQWLLTSNFACSPHDLSALRSQSVKGIALEFMRRIDAGEYTFTGSDGRERNRPLPSTATLARQFGCGEGTMRAVVGHLTKLGYLQPRLDRRHPSKLADSRPRVMRPPVKQDEELLQKTKSLAMSPVVLVRSATTKVTPNPNEVNDPCVSRIVDAIRAELANPISLWNTSHFPTVIELKKIFHVDDFTIRAVVYSLAYDGVLIYRKVQTRRGLPVWRYVPTTVKDPTPIPWDAAEHLAIELRNELLKPSSRWRTQFPTMDQIRRHFRISHDTARRAVGYLIEDGVLARGSRRRSRLVVATRADSPRPARSARQEER